MCERGLRVREESEETERTARQVGKLRSTHDANAIPQTRGLDVCKGERVAGQERALCLGDDPLG